MLKINLFRPKVKYVITPCTFKSFLKKLLLFFSFSIRNENTKSINKRKKSKNFLTPSKNI